MVSCARHFLRLSLSLIILTLMLALAPAMGLSSIPGLASPPGAHTDIPGPAGSGHFGKQVFALPNGNLVVTDPDHDFGPVADIGAVYLLDGETGATISMLHGQTANDHVGADVKVLSSGNYVIFSPDWDSTRDVDAGAVTWCSGETGCSGLVSSANSLIGGSPLDASDADIAVELSNGKYVVRFPHWSNAGQNYYGAVTLCSGTGICSGVVSSANSLVGSTASDSVGTYVVALGSNYVVHSPGWHNGGAANAGAVTWCNSTIGCKGVVSSTNSLVGSSAGDLVGNALINSLANGDYVVGSPTWHNGSTANAGAATWCSGTIGCTGTISSTNSLVGSSANDMVGWYVFPLPSGNYIVLNPNWQNGGAAKAGAVTWCNGMAGCVGPVSASNSLVGSSANDLVGFGFFILTNGNYVVDSTHWQNGGEANAGAVTLCNGAGGCTGPVTSSNSLVGSSANDQVGNIKILNNSNYIIFSPFWDNGIADVGAVIRCDGVTGCKGTLSAANALVGSSTGDEVGSDGITKLSNGNYVVASQHWHNTGLADAGAVTWCNGTTGCTGVVLASNSLVGSSAGDEVGQVSSLNNGNYVVASQHWHNTGLADAGAVTWCNGTIGCTGAVLASNSLEGSSAGDKVGYDITFLPNGNYVVRSPFWRNGGAAGAGAATWCSRGSGCLGPVSDTNSLVGSSAGDQVGSFIYGLTNGNYVVLSPIWSNGGSTGVGAATWCSGVSGCAGVVSPSNSLVGSVADDKVGLDFVLALKTGNYLVRSHLWDNSSAVDAGAVSWCSGIGGCTGTVSALNSLIGSHTHDYIGLSDIFTLNNGYYIFISPEWDSGIIADAGAVTLGNGRVPMTIGPVSLKNSVIGATAGGGSQLVYDFDSYHNQLVVGRPAENIVSLFRSPYLDTYIPMVLR